MQTFIDSLSTEAQERVLRNLSCNPASSGWRNSVEYCDAFSALTLAHPLSGVARVSFNKVTVGCGVETNRFETVFQQN